jgi:hypothetical protein
VRPLVVNVLIPSQPLEVVEVEAQDGIVVRINRPVIIP